MKVLSLFDGISCGMVALERVGIKVDKYFASEICDYSSEISKKNFPEIVQVGDIRNLKSLDFDNIDLIIGGSPCQSFSFAGKRNGMTTKEEVKILTLSQYLFLKEEGFEFEGQSYLFWEFVRLLKEVKPKYFLLENVKMSKEWKDIISAAVGVEAILINSELVSAQSRERLYWTNIPQFEEISDKFIYIDDILEKDTQHVFLPKHRLDYNNYDKSKVDKSIFKNTSTQIGNSRKFGNSVRSNGKAFTLRKSNPNGIIDENYNIRSFTPIEAERLQTLPDNYTFLEGLSNSKRYSSIGNGWTVDVICHLLKNLKEVFDKTL